MVPVFIPGWNSRYGGHSKNTIPGSNTTLWYCNKRSNFSSNSMFAEVISLKQLLPTPFQRMEVEVRKHFSNIFHYSSHRSTKVFCLYLKKYRCFQSVFTTRPSKKLTGLLNLRFFDTSLILSKSKEVIWNVCKQLRQKILASNWKPHSSVFISPKFHKKTNLS